MDTPDDRDALQARPRLTLTGGMIIADRYRLLSRIGGGAMGVVWSAINIFTDRQVALKFISSPDEGLRNRLEREARACGALNHRNVIDVYDLVQAANGEPVLVMQLLQGETLAELLRRRRRLDAPLAALIARDIAAALAAIHTLRIVHRDLKPANIFLHQEPGGGRPIVKVLDFGVSKRLADLTHPTAPGEAVGSLAYMSPEQIRASSHVDARADLWSLGVVLFEMLTGHRPFKGEVTAVLTQILQGEIPRVSRHLWRIDPALVELVASCMRREREERIGPADRIAQALDAFVGIADPWSQPSSDPPTSTRNPALVPSPPPGEVEVDDNAPTNRIDVRKLPLPRRPEPSLVEVDVDVDMITRMQPPAAAQPAPRVFPPQPSPAAPWPHAAPPAPQAAPPWAPRAEPMPSAPPAMEWMPPSQAPSAEAAGPASVGPGLMPQRAPMPSDYLHVSDVAASRRRVASLAGVAVLTVATGASGAGILSVLLPEPRPAVARELPPLSVETPSKKIPEPPSPPVTATPKDQLQKPLPAPKREPGTPTPTTTPTQGGASTPQKPAPASGGAPAARRCEKLKFVEYQRCVAQQKTSRS